MLYIGNRFYQRLTVLSLVQGTNQAWFRISLNILRVPYFPYRETARERFFGFIS